MDKLKSSPKQQDKRQDMKTNMFIAEVVIFGYFTTKIV